MTDTFRVVGVNQTTGQGNLITNSEFPGQWNVPDFSNFTWVNQGTATYNRVARGGTVMAVLTSPQVAASSLRLLVTSMPSTPYNLECGLHWVPMANFNGCGLAIRESSTGKLMAVGINGYNVVGVTVAKWTNPTSFSASYLDTTALSCEFPDIFFRITDNGTNFISQVSGDGFRYRTIHTISRTDFMTAPDQVGIYWNSDNNSSAATYAIKHFTTNGPN